MEARIIVSFDIGVKNLAVSVLRVWDSNPNAQCLLWKIISLAGQNEKIPVLNELTGRLYMELDNLVVEIDAHGQVDTVLLENQPSRLNGSMKSIQMLIYGYFQLRRHWEGHVKHVQMISAAKKLVGHPHETLVPATDKTGYELNKWKAIQLASLYVSNCPVLQGVLAGYKKKDDLADALLQGISWLRKHGADIHQVYGTKEDDGAMMDDHA